MSPRLLQNWWLDIKTCKASSKISVNGVVVTIAGFQSGSPSSIFKGGENFGVQKLKIVCRHLKWGSVSR